MRIRTTFPHQIECHEDVRIPMRDGCRLSARIWRPVGAATKPVPAILEHLPYRKRDGTIARDSLTHPWLAGHGYACIRTDMRGNGDSAGLMDDEYSAQELLDACDVIAWLREQPWCSGAVGMMGISWGGFNSLQVAALRPEGLMAIITICSTVDRYADDIHYKGGCQLVENLGWATQMLAYSSRPPDPAIVGDDWKRMWLDRLERQPFLLEAWLSHQRRDDYWKHGSVCEDYRAIEAAVLSIGGWHDGYRNTISNLVSNVAAPVKGIVGPWIHKYPHMAGPRPAIGFLQEALRWWDRWLKGIDTGVEDDPTMRLWLMDAVKPRAWLEERPGRWIAEARWPAESVKDTTLHLTDRGLSDAAGPLSATVASPADCGACTGEYFPFAYGPELPIDQRSDDALSTCFDGEPLAHPVDIVGAPRLGLALGSETLAAQIAVRLCDVFPDGTSALVTMGVLNLCHRNSHEHPEPLPIDEQVDIALTLDQIAYRVPAGHRLRVAVSTAYWPFIWPAPEPATLRISRGHLTLPLRPPAEGPEWHFEEPEAAAPWSSEVIEKPVCTRHREIDLETGASVMAMTNSAGKIRDLEHGLVTSSTTQERWSISPDDPLSAKGDIRWMTAMERDEWQVRTEAHATLQADLTHFHLRARLRAWEGEDEVFERVFEKSIPRDGM